MNTGPIPGLCDVLVPLPLPSVGTSSFERVARIWGVIGGVDSGDGPPRFTTEDTAGTGFQGELPVAEDGARARESGSIGTDGLRCGARQFGASDAGGKRGVELPEAVCGRVEGRTAEAFEVSASAIMAFISTLNTMSAEFYMKNEDD